MSKCFEKCRKDQHAQKHLKLKPREKTFKIIEKAQTSAKKINTHTKHLLYTLY